MKKAEFKIVCVMFIVMHLHIDKTGTQELNVIWFLGFRSILKLKAHFIVFSTLSFGILAFEANPHLASFGFCCCCYFKLRNLIFLSQSHDLFFQENTEVISMDSRARLPQFEPQVSIVLDLGQATQMAQFLHLYNGHNNNT